jgi:hypothetical protein
MTPELWQRLKPLFHAALQEGTESRAAFIEAACASDMELEAHLQQLLEAERRDSGSLEASLADVNDFLDKGVACSQTRFYLAACPSSAQ